MRTKILSALAVAAVLVAGATASFATETAADTATGLKVQLALLEKLGTDALHVDVNAHNGAVRLSGTVYKRETAELASSIAESVSGVASVDEDIAVKSADAGAVGKAVTEGEHEVQDGILKSKVRLVLIDKLGGDGFRISTDVASSVVTLTFPADMVAARRSEAKAAVKALAGVKDVISLDKT